MEIIEELNRVWNGIAPDGEDFVDKKEKYEADLERLQLRLARLQKAKEDNAQIKDTTTEIGKINAILEFMDYIGVERKELPFETIDHDIISCEIDLLLAQAYAEMYTYYTNYLRENSHWDTYIPRKKGGLFLSETEFFIDIACLTYDVKKMLKGNDGEINKELINYYTVSNMKDAGHPIKDRKLENGFAEMVAAICRVSWECTYIKNLVNDLIHNGFGGLACYYRDQNKTNPIFNMWEEDTEYLNHVEAQDNVFYKVYRRVLDSDKIWFYDDFIRQFREEHF